MKKIVGFTFIELLSVIAIIGILSAMALPMYDSHLAKMHRLMAENELIRLASALERYHIENQTYAGATLPQLGEKNPTVNDAYQIQWITNEKSFILQAIPNARQKAQDGCGILIFTSTGKKSNCW